MTETFAILAAIVFAAYVAQTVAGFGAMVITLTVGAHWFSIPDMLTLLVPVSLVQTGYIAITDRRVVDRVVLLQRVLPLMGLGTIAGYALSVAIDGNVIKQAFGVMVAVLAARELWRLRSNSDSAPLSKPVTALAMAGAGVTHGMYACGGPLLVYAIGKTGMDKRAFRATLSAIFFVLNIALTATYVASGRVGVDHLPRIGLLLAVLAIALAAGEWAHRRIAPRPFSLFVYTLLLCSGVALI